MNIKLIWAIIFMILGILKILEAFQIQKKLYTYTINCWYILYGVFMPIYSSGIKSWKEIIENWHYLLLTYTIFLIILLLMSIFKGYTVSLYSNDEKKIIDAIIQTLTDDNYNYNYEEEFGRIVFSINKYKKIRLTPVTKFFKDEVKCYNITYSLFKKKQLENLHQKIYNELNISNDNNKTKKQFYWDLVFGVIYLCFSVLIIAFNNFI